MDDKMNRREFFRKSTAQAIPFLALLSSGPLLTGCGEDDPILDEKEEEYDRDDINPGCETCKGTAQSNSCTGCSGTAKSNSCTGCSGTAKSNSCTGCLGTAKTNTCTGCGSSCKNLCSNTCQNTCRGGCDISCLGGCKGGCRGDCEGTATCLYGHCYGYR